MLAKLVSSYHEFLTEVAFAKIKGGVSAACVGAAGMAPYDRHYPNPS